MSQHHSIHLPRNPMRMEHALGWALGLALSGARRFVIADFTAKGAEDFKAELQKRGHNILPRNAKLVTLCPQRNEFRHGLMGGTWDVAICKSIDLWPVVNSPSCYAPNSPQNLLMAAILTWIKGPILCTFEDAQRGLAPLMSRTIPSGMSNRAVA